MSAGEEVEDALYPIAVLLDELKNEDVQLRLNATRRLPTIAAALGTERTRCELIPFLTETIDDEDEVLMALAEQLDKFVEFVGGPDYAGVLLQPLEILSAVEETIVRDLAVDSLRHISDLVATTATDHGRDMHVNQMFPLIKRLAQGDWFTSRISACALVATVFKNISSDREDLKFEVLTLFQAMARDETPMVRRAASSALGALASACAAHDRAWVEKEIVPVFQELADDEQDSVRLLTVENSALFCSSVSDEVRNEVMLPIVCNFVNDKSWRVRYMMADKLVSICEAFGPVATRDDFLPVLIRLIKDGEAEVRTAAAFKVTEMTRLVVQTPSDTNKLGGKDLVVREVLPAIRELVTDPSQHARAAFASNVMGLAPEVGLEITVRDVLELVLVLLKDEFPDVRLNVISRLDKVSLMMGIDRLSSELLPAIVELAEDRNWRVRLAIVEHIPLLAKQLGREVFQDEMNLGDLCLNWLGDCVFSIREAAIKSLKELSQIFGDDWSRETIVPKIVSLFSSSANYLYRMTALHAVGVLAEVLSSDLLEKSLLPILTDQACEDPVPNIRFVAAKTLGKLAPFVRAEARESKIRPALKRLSESTEADADVIHFSKEALTALNACAP
ncbi:Serine/threonine-protein phosphatase 2A 65 kDa regulatory subunit A alpha isoform [Porphyridium purpureum]|uniref:Serine/threonine-protein phosphatase 2A 65 kDa regulatory subunit A alpha isoform n=1 Tax=Porphyridium purpureum TaxID=35688 RepID=A0A5J4YFJ0_PORPP|nr:Serine/threonine-protein phosphatase 2A 65 kDa regulatory subunit A alpha isoform [Porphyridium purpureum]|eukprot:POR4466..scf269_36